MHPFPVPLLFLKIKQETEERKMKVELGKIGSVRQGVVLNRVKGKNGEPEENYPLLTIGRLLQEEEGASTEEQATVSVAESKKSSLKLAKEGMILIGLTSFHRAVVLTKEKEGMVIPSNFLILEFPGGIMDAHYFAWYFNESPEMESLKESIIHGEGKVKVLSIQQIRSIKIEVPDLVTQMAVGNLYSLQLKKSRIWRQILRLEMQNLTVRMGRVCEPVQMDNTDERGTETTVTLKKLYTELRMIEDKMNIYEKELELFL